MPIPAVHPFAFVLVPLFFFLLGRYVIKTVTLSNGTHHPAVIYVTMTVALHPCHRNSSTMLLSRSHDFPQLSSTVTADIYHTHIMSTFSTLFSTSSSQSSTPHQTRNMKSAMMAIARAAGAQAFMVPRWVRYVTTNDCLAQLMCLLDK